jgi:hypothetical protein
VKTAQSLGVRSILDVGCGLGMKLVGNFHSLDIETTGRCRENHHTLQNRHEMGGG